MIPTGKICILNSNYSAAYRAEINNNQANTGNTKEWNLYSRFNAPKCFSVPFQLWGFFFFGSTGI
jgi:hypothetical protein